MHCLRRGLGHPCVWAFVCTEPQRGSSEARVALSLSRTLHLLHAAKCPQDTLMEGNGRAGGTTGLTLAVPGEDGLGREARRFALFWGALDHGRRKGNYTPFLDCTGGLSGCQTDARPKTRGGYKEGHIGLRPRQWARCLLEGIAVPQHAPLVPCIAGLAPTLEGSSRSSGGSRALPYLMLFIVACAGQLWLT